jgi:hypothetical protein
MNVETVDQMILLNSCASGEICKLCASSDWGMSLILGLGVTSAGAYGRGA